jgi:4'-phosphopantetheinyl transferase
VLTLARHEVHVWRTSLELGDEHVQRLQQTLAADEIARARRFHFEKDRRHFMVARGVLRTILSRYLGIEPRQVEFS